MTRSTVAAATIHCLVRGGTDLLNGSGGADLLVGRLGKACCKMALGADHDRFTKGDGSA